MDQFDKATELEELAREKAIALQRSKVMQGKSLAQCEDCGTDIPLARRAAITGVKTCIDCQIVNEKKGNFYAR